MGSPAMPAMTSHGDTADWMRTSLREMTLKSPHRLHAMCPYFAMFPASFAREHIAENTSPGELVLDPFSGRGTTLLEALLSGREALAADINPVAFCVSGAKAEVPSLDSLIAEIDSLERRFDEVRPIGADVPPFFHRCFHPATLEQLSYLRGELNWRGDAVHRFIAALALGTLHGESDGSRRYLSNQMPRTISPKPGYSLRYWRARQLWPPRRDVFDRLREEAAFRLRDGAPERHGRVLLADSRHLARHLPSVRGRVAAVVTSPPYFDMTSFEEDQWLRLWMLGSDPQPSRGKVSKDDRHTSEVQYWAFLRAVWMGVEPLLRSSATIVCRLGAKGLSTRPYRPGWRTPWGKCFRPWNYATSHVDRHRPGAKQIRSDPEPSQPRSLTSSSMCSDTAWQLPDVESAGRTAHTSCS